MGSDCIVAGGGIIGLLTARELADAGLEVTLIERGEVGREASWAGAGILSPLHPWRVPAALAPLLGWSLACYPTLARELCESTGIDPEWAQCGMWMLDETLSPEVSAWARVSAQVVEYFDSAGVAQREPRLRAPQGGIWLPGISQIRSPRLLCALLHDLQRRGVAIVTHCEVTRLRHANGCMEGVETSTGRYEAPVLVVAAGAWSGALLAGLPHTPPIEPVRGQMILLRGEPGALTRIVLRGACYIVPRRSGRLLVGSTVEYAGFDKSITELARTDLYQTAAEIAPCLAEYPIEAHWAGLRPGIRGDIPIIGPHPDIRGLFLSSGHFRNGVALAPGSARLLADRILNRPPIIAAEPFGWPRCPG
ncbi:MAG: glycine oxidase ThiO [Gammaproteobacteria bacterium]